MRYVASLLFIVAAVAQQSDETVTVKLSDLPSDLQAKVKRQQTIGQFGSWAGMGKEVGTAMHEGLGAITDETNKFANTNVGKFTMWIIAWKVIGYPVLQFAFGVPLWITGTILFITILRKKFLPFKVLVKEERGVDAKVWTKTYKTVNEEVDGIEIFGASVCYVLFCIGCCMVMFIH